MDKKAKIITAAVAGAAAASLPVRAALHREAKVDVPPMPDEHVDLARFRKNLSDAIKI